MKADSYPDIESGAGSRNWIFISKNLRKKFTVPNFSSCWYRSNHRQINILIFNLSKQELRKGWGLGTDTECRLRNSTLSGVVFSLYFAPDVTSCFISSEFKLTCLTICFVQGSGLQSGARISGQTGESLRGSLTQVQFFPQLKRALAGMIDWLMQDLVWRYRRHVRAQ